LRQHLDSKPDTDYLLLSDPIHLVYLANFFVDPFSLGGGLLEQPTEIRSMATTRPTTNLRMNTSRSTDTEYDRRPRSGVVAQ